MINNIFQAVGGTIAVLILIVMVLAYVGSSPSQASLNENMLTSAYLEKNQEDYVKCKNSVGGEGDALIGSVVWANLSNYSLEKLSSIEDNYKAQIKQQCDKPIAEYEENYAKLVKNENEIAESSKSLLDKIIKSKPTVDNTKLSKYNPETSKFTIGNPLNNLVFTKTDVETYFNRQL